MEPTKDVSRGGHRGFFSGRGRGSSGKSKDESAIDGRVRKAGSQLSKREEVEKTRRRSKSFDLGSIGVGGASGELGLHEFLVSSPPSSGFSKGEKRSGKRLVKKSSEEKIPINDLPMIHDNREAIKFDSELKGYLSKELKRVGPSTLSEEDVSRSVDECCWKRIDKDWKAHPLIDTAKILIDDLFKKEDMLTEQISALLRSHFFAKQKPILTSLLNALERFFDDKRHYTDSSFRFYNNIKSLILMYNDGSRKSMSKGDDQAFKALLDHCLNSVVFGETFCDVFNGKETTKEFVKKIFCYGEGSGRVELNAKVRERLLKNIAVARTCERKFTWEASREEKERLEKQLVEEVARAFVPQHNSKIISKNIKINKEALELDDLEKTDPSNQRKFLSRLLASIYKHAKIKKKDEEIVIDEKIPGAMILRLASFNTYARATMFFKSIFPVLSEEIKGGIVCPSDKNRLDIELTSLEDYATTQTKQFVFYSNDGVGSSESPSRRHLFSTNVSWKVYPERKEGSKELLKGELSISYPQRLEATPSEWDSIMNILASPQQL
ncbi:MAG: hypothetical protein K940chlam7_01659 [Chlamydiae bacterium]|nr:hypothetical protein [Chlamydiota bacterium]